MNFLYWNFFSFAYLANLTFAHTYSGHHLNSLLSTCSMLKIMVGFTLSGGSGLCLMKHIP